MSDQGEDSGEGEVDFNFEDMGFTVVDDVEEEEMEEEDGEEMMDGIVVLDEVSLNEQEDDNLVEIDSLSNTGVKKELRSPHSSSNRHSRNRDEGRRPHSRDRKSHESSTHHHRDRGHRSRTPRSRTPSSRHSKSSSHHSRTQRKDDDKKHLSSHSKDKSSSHESRQSSRSRYPPREQRKMASDKKPLHSDHGDMTITVLEMEDNTEPNTDALDLVSVDLYDKPSPSKHAPIKKESDTTRSSEKKLISQRKDEKVANKSEVKTKSAEKAISDQERMKSRSPVVRVERLSAAKVNDKEGPKGNSNKQDNAKRLPTTTDEPATELLMEDTRTSISKEQQPTHSKKMELHLKTGTISSSVVRQTDSEKKSTDSEKKSTDSEKKSTEEDKNVEEKDVDEASKEDQNVKEVADEKEKEVKQEKLDSPESDVESDIMIVEKEPEEPVVIEVSDDDIEEFFITGKDVDSDGNMQTEDDSTGSEIQNQMDKEGEGSAKESKTQDPIDKEEELQKAEDSIQTGDEMDKEETSLGEAPVTNDASEAVVSQLDQNCEIQTRNDHDQQNQDSESSSLPVVKENAEVSNLEGETSSKANDDKSKPHANDGLCSDGSKEDHATEHEAVSEEDVQQTDLNQDAASVVKDGEIQILPAMEKEGIFSCEKEESKESESSLQEQEVSTSVITSDKEINVTPDESTSATAPVEDKVADQSTAEASPAPKVDDQGTVTITVAGMGKGRKKDDADRIIGIENFKEKVAKENTANQNSNVEWCAVDNIDDEEEENDQQVNFEITDEDRLTDIASEEKEVDGATEKTEMVTIDLDEEEEEDDIQINADDTLIETKETTAAEDEEMDLVDLDILDQDEEEEDVDQIDEEKTSKADDNLEKEEAEGENDRMELVVMDNIEEEQEDIGEIDEDAFNAMMEMEGLVDVDEVSGDVDEDSGDVDDNAGDVYEVYEDDDEIYGDDDEVSGDVDEVLGHDDEGREVQEEGHENEEKVESGNKKAPEESDDDVIIVDVENGFKPKKVVYKRVLKKGSATPKTSGKSGEAKSDENKVPEGDDRDFEEEEGYESSGDESDDEEDYKAGTNMFSGMLLFSLLNRTHI